MKTPSERFSVYVVEDDKAVQKSLCALLNAHGFETIPCDSAESFLEIYDSSLNSCMILDLRLPKMNGKQLQSHLIEMDERLPIIVLTAHGDVPIAVQAMRDGAIDFLEKPARIQQLLESLHMAEGVLFNRLPNTIPKSIVAARIKKLTEREHEVLLHLVNGKLNKEIAADLGVSLRTIEVHRARIREKMQARGIADLIRMLR